MSVVALLVLLLTVVIGHNAQAQNSEKEKAKEQAKAEAYMEEARHSLNRSRYEEAAEKFARVHELAIQKELAGDALYWEAFARFRMERTVELKVAAELLAIQAQEYAMVATAAEGEALAARVYAELAERGEVEAAREITYRASEEELRQETRTAALQALMQMDPEKAMPMLEKIIRDDSSANQSLRHNALFIMCRQDDQMAEDLLIDLLKTEEDPEFIANVIMCLSRFESDRSLQTVMEVFRTTDNPEVAEAALVSVGHHGGRETFNFLVEIATDSNRSTETRAHALLALSVTGRDDEVTPLLINILETEKDQEIQEMALMSLSRIDSSAARKALMDLALKPGADEELKSVALHFAAMSQNLNIEDLRGLYQGAQSGDLKQQICHVLTMIDDEEAALDLLIEISRTETDPQIKRDAVFWIGQFNNEKAADYLMEILNQP